MILFLIINIGLFMSLFVSVITVLFDLYSKNDRIYQLVETLKVRSTTEADKNYSLLISVPPPLNLLLLFTAPCLVTSRDPQKTNRKLLLLFFTPILVVTTCVFVAGEAVMWPLVYVKMVFHKLTMTWVYSKQYRSTRADKFVNFIWFFFLGPFIIVGNTVIDTYFFVRHMIMHELKKKKHKTKFVPL